MIIFEHYPMGSEELMNFLSRERLFSAFCFIKGQLFLSVWDILERAECRCEGVGQVQWGHEMKLRLWYGERRKLVGETFRKLFGR